MSVTEKSAVADRIREMAQEHHVTYVRTPRDALAHHITRLSGDDVELDDIEQLLIALQRSGHLSRIEMVKLQDGDPRVIEDPSRLTRASNRKALTAPRAGYVTRIDTEAVGTAAMLIGAGREKLGDKIDHAVGLTLHRKLGERVSKGEPLVTLHYNGTSRLQDSEECVAEAYEIQDSPPAAQRLIRTVIDGEGKSS